MWRLEDAAGYGFVVADWSDMDILLSQADVVSFKFPCRSVI
ncbi:MAG: hypothetical protein ACLTL2_12715 [Blautia sp.]